MSFSAHSAFLCDRLLNMFCSAAYKLAPPFGHIKVELCPGLEPNSWTKSAKPQCLCGIILFVLLYRNHRSGARSLLLSSIISSSQSKIYKGSIRAAPSEYAHPPRRHFLPPTMEKAETVAFITEKIQQNAYTIRKKP